VKNDRHALVNIWAERTIFTQSVSDEGYAMAKLIDPVARLFVSSRAFQLIVVVGFAVIAAAALVGSASALPPDPCFD